MQQPDERSRRRFLKVISMLGLAVAFSPRALVEAFAASKTKTIQKENTTTRISATQATDWTEKAYPKLIHYNRLPKGTHFAAWEQPQFFTEELRAAFRPLRMTAAA